MAKNRSGRESRTACTCQTTKKHNRHRKKLWTRDTFRLLSRLSPCQILAFASVPLILAQACRVSVGIALSLAAHPSARALIKSLAQDCISQVFRRLSGA
jgi:hypothetical protein